MKQLGYISFALLLLTSCQNSAALRDEPIRLNYPSWFGNPRITEGNEPTKLRVELGRRLFYDTRLSADNSTSCATCHVQSSAFTDGKSISTNAHGIPGKRNSPSLQNLAWTPYFMMEGGVPTLEMQVLAPVQEPLEMHGNFEQIIQQLSQDQELAKLSKIAYNRDIDVYVITRALACFERTFISGDSRFDRFFYQKKTDELTEEEKHGMELFFSSKTQCATCHTPPFFSDFQFYDVGLYQNPNDTGKERDTFEASDRGKFKTPSLRNVELTAPYMHDGSLNSLEEVVDLFNIGGHLSPNQDPRISPLQLTDDEQQDLIAFLKTLTDWTFVQNPNFLPLEQ
jgi:cytochrome c peroxidase